MTAFGIEVDFVAFVVLHRNVEKKKDGGGDTAAADTTNKKKPNLACVWIDPFWSGLVVRGVDGFFHVRGRITPLAVPRLIAAAADVEEEEETNKRRTLCNSVKLHFYDESDAGTQWPEVRRDFLYASGFPLAHLLLAGPPIHHHGLFNYNVDTDATGPLPYARLLIRPLACMRPPPPCVLLLASSGPSVDMHANVIHVSEWINAALLQLDPTHREVALYNMRTYCRDQHNTLLFQDLPTLFALPHSYLPPTLALYALHGALWVNGCRRLDASRFLYVIHDLIACFTLCGHEGLYWFDTCGGAPTEDQPFPLSFGPSERVFTKDDCEGRASHVQLMVGLLIDMHRHRPTLDALRQTPSYRQLLSRLDDAEVAALLEACCCIGGLFESGELVVQTTIGEICLKEGAPPEGHSFSLLFYRGKEEEEVRIVEGTNWERSAPRVPVRAAAESDALIERVMPFYEGHFLGEQQMPVLHLCAAVSHEVEERMYGRVYIGHDCIYFTTTTASTLEYGVSLHTLRNEPERVLCLSTRAFLHACVTGKEDARFPKRAGAQEALMRLDALRAALPHQRRVLRPPPRTEAETEALMCALWAPLEPTTRSATTTAGPMDGYYFSVPQYASQPPPLRSRSLTLTTTPFMRSHLYHVIADA